MRSILLSIVVIAAFSQAIPLAHAQENDSLRALAQRYWDGKLEYSPTYATTIGDHRFNDRLDDLSFEAVQARQAELGNLLREVLAIKKRNLSDDDLLTRELLSHMVTADTSMLSCGRHLVPLDPLYGPHVVFSLIPSTQPFNSVQDYENYIARLKAFPIQVSQIIENLRLGLSARVTSPQVQVEKVIPQLKAHLVHDTSTSVFFVRPAKMASALNKDERQEILAKLTGAIEADVIPAYLRLLAFVEDDYLPLCRKTVGISEIPNGSRIYEGLVSVHTSIPIKPNEIHEYGLSEVKRITNEMQSVKQKIGFEGTLGEFIEHLRTDQKYRAKSADELVSHCEQILARAKHHLPEIIADPPKTDVIIKKLEAFRSEASPQAFYYAAPLDGSRPAHLGLNVANPGQSPLYLLEPLVYHEAIPGHHLQTAITQESTDWAMFRRNARIYAYEEGWALYSESLGEEFGGYATPLQRFGRLNFDMWRACRLVVDTGLHAKGWTRSQAIEYLKDHTAFPMSRIEAEVDRYITWPGQALAYKIGERVFKRIRTNVEQSLGDSFDIRKFHSALLRKGPMPLRMLEEQMNEWAAKEANAKP